MKRNKLGKKNLLNPTPIVLQALRNPDSGETKNLHLEKEPQTILLLDRVSV